MRPTFSKFAPLAALGVTVLGMPVLGVAVAGCQASQRDSAAAATSTPTATAAPAGPAASAGQPGAGSPAAASPTTVTAPPAATARSPPASAAAPTSIAPSPATAPTTGVVVAVVGVVANCDDPEPHPLSRRPSSIVLACADAGIGVQDLTWTGWKPSSATGRGVFWENECVPTASCGSAQFSRYPVAVTLSAVKASTDGPWFSRLTVTWEAGRPPNQTPDSFTLTPPGSTPTTAGA
jgi:hypothetical protein